MRNLCVIIEDRNRCDDDRQNVVCNLMSLFLNVSNTGIGLSFVDAKDG